MAKTRRPKQMTGYKAQVAALPLRSGGAFGPEVMLITSRGTQRWIIPKGWPMKGRKDHDAAAVEARQEAGLVGSVSKKPIGHFTYEKTTMDGSTPCRVSVFRLDVDRQLKNWREKDQRVAAWFPIEDAAQRVDDAGLARIIESLGAASDPHEGT